jgi:hypothetical protein
VRNPATSDLALDTNNLARIVHVMAVQSTSPPPNQDTTTPPLTTPSPTLNP